MMKNLRAGDIVSGVFLIAVGSITLAGASNIVSAVGGKMHPRTLPMVLGIVLLAGGVWLIARTFSKEYQDKPIEWPPPGGGVRWFVSLSMMVIYAGMMQVLGFLLSSGLFVSGFVWYFGKHRAWFAIAWGVGTMVFIYALFIWLLSMELPAGLLLLQ
jgi:putative tricarboxylic transport membrane protein